MRRLVLIVLILVAYSSEADTPQLDTVANCSTDWECENGPDE